MFTGIIEDRGKVIRVEYQGQEKRVTIGLPPHLTEVQLGDSINVNGVCLTVAKIKGQAVELDLSQETLQRTVLGELKEGDEINLERALKVTDRLGGHIVTGHIDGIGVIVDKRKERDFFQLRLKIPESVSRYVVQKGSIAIDGISLTVNEYQGGEVQITLIPYTIEKTTLKDKKAGDRVNLEADILGKYVEKLFGQRDKKSGEVDRSFLIEHGFVKGD
jgi:riboflavin synthase